MKNEEKMIANKRFKRKKSVTGKDHEKVIGLYNRGLNATHDIFRDMQKETPITGGRMQFKDRIHYNKPENLHPYDSSIAAQNALYYKRHESDYNDKSGIKYEEPPRKIFTNKFDSFVKNRISNKAKTVIRDLSPKN